MSSDDLNPRFVVFGGMSVAAVAGLVVLVLLFYRLTPDAPHNPPPLRATPVDSGGGQGGAGGTGH
jgi:hypothetical protein